MRVAITGGAGLFGHGLTQVFRSRHTVFPLTHADLDVTKPDQVREVIAKHGPDIVIHTAAIRDLEPCEDDPAKAFLVNFHGTRNVVEAARSIGAGVVYTSTDAVFDGEKQSPYTERDTPRPLSVYGRTKLRAEQYVRGWPRSWVFRVSVLFGPGKTNFVEQGLRKLAAGQEYDVAAEQMGSATYTLDAAAKIMEVVEAGRCGLYHLSNSGVCSRIELAKGAAELAGLNPAGVVGKTPEELGRRAIRPKYAVAAMEALTQAGFAPPRPWQEALGEYVKSLSLHQRVVA